MRLIDADALTDELIKGIEADTGKSVQTTFTKSVCMILCKAIEQQPTIDAEPVRHGKWIWNDKCRRVCSVCENPVAFMLSKDGWHEGRYCPNCGARMDEND